MQASIQIMCRDQVAGDYPSVVLCNVYGTFYHFKVPDFIAIGSCSFKTGLVKRLVRLYRCDTD